MSNKKSQVYLGFIDKEDIEPFNIEEDFPDGIDGKIGGKPVWLIPKNIPTNLICLECQKPLSLLLQIYAPLEDPTTFHRIIYIFCCYNGKCHLTPYYKNIFKVIRSQLPKNNSFYIPNQNNNKNHWKLKEFIKEENFNNQNNFKEFILITEPEELKNQEEKSISEEYKKLMESIQNEEIDESFFENIKKDKIFLQFQKRLKYYPEQILRYYGCGDNIPEPIWISSENQPDISKDIPKCLNCGSERIAEFQILPQLLYMLEIEQNELTNSMDWGILTIYTCKKSCNKYNEEDNYFEEFLWRQNIISS